MEAALDGSLTVIPVDRGACGDVAEAFTITATTNRRIVYWRSAMAEATVGFWSIL